MNRKSKWSVGNLIFPILACAFIIWATHYTVLGFVAGEHHFPRNIFEAARSGSTWQIGKFLDRGANINAKDDMGYTPIMWAVNRNKLPAAKYLVSKGADVNAHNYYETALRLALMNKNQRMVELLLHHGAKVNDRDENGQTPLLMLVSMTSCFGKNERLAELLINNGADVNARDKYKSSALGYAERYHWDNTVRFLRAHGAKP